MEANEYQKQARSFAKLGGRSFAYAACGLVEEIGELFEKLDFTDDGSAESICVGKVRADMIRLSKKAGKIAKHIRKDWNSLPESTRAALAKPGSNHTEGWANELGDVSWFLAGLCSTLGKRMDGVFRQNIEKLSDRKNRGVIIGSGDNR